MDWITGVIVSPPLLCIGIFGQTLNLIILTHSNVKNVTFMYLQSVSLAELFSILALIPILLRYIFGSLIESGQWPCWILVYTAHIEASLVHALAAANAYLILGLILERYLHVKHPVWAQKLNGTTKKAGLNIIGLYSLSFLLSIPSTFQENGMEFNLKNETRFEWENGNCSKLDWWMDQYTYTIYYIFREIITGLIPILALAWLTLCLLQAVRRTPFKKRRLISLKRFSTRRKNRGERNGPRFVKQMNEIANENDPLNTAGNETTTITYPNSGTLALRYKGTMRDKGHSERQRKHYILAVITACVYLACNGPTCILSFIMINDGNQTDMRSAALLLQLLGHSINFYMYCLCSTEYRRMLVKVIEHCLDAVRGNSEE